MPKDFEVNEVVNLTRLLAPLGLSGPPEELEWPVDDAARQAVDEWFNEYGLNERQGAIGIHIGATHSEKAWPLERWIELSKQIVRTFPERPLILTGAADDRELTNQIEAVLTGHVINLAGRDNFQSLAELQRRLALFISTDSGPRHLAAAVGCPTIAIYGWTDPRRWGAFYEADKHSALSIGDPIMTPEELEVVPQAAVKRVTVNHVMKAIADIIEK